MIETLIVFPVILAMGLGVVHLGLVYQAKSNLEYAALMAARVGSVTGISLVAMQNELARRMAPSQVGLNVLSPGAFSIEVLNPTVAMFQDCGVQPADTTDCVELAYCEIPNYGLQYRSVGSECDGASIQDANVLRIKVTFNFNSNIPFMNVPLYSGDTGYGDNVGTRISAIATVRMQTPARYTAIFHPPI